MDLKELFDKVDKDKLKEALGADDPEMLKSLLAAGNISITDEQMDYIAGGGWGAPIQTC